MTKYENSWQSLNARPVPAWFEDAKFGIFIHWGLYSVPAYTQNGAYAEWYWKQLEEEGSEAGAFHKRVYGENAHYEDFVSAAGEYLEDAHQIGVMMNTLDEKAAFFMEATGRIDSKLNDVSVEATSEKERVGTLSEAVGDLAENVTNILEDTAVNDKVSEELKQEILKFRAI